MYNDDMDEYTPAAAPQQSFPSKPPPQQTLFRPPPLRSKVVHPGMPPPPIRGTNVPIQTNPPAYPRSLNASGRSSSARNIHLMAPPSQMPPPPPPENDIAPPPQSTSPESDGRPPITSQPPHMAAPGRTYSTPTSPLHSNNKRVPSGPITPSSLSMSSSSPTTSVIRGKPIMRGRFPPPPPSMQPKQVPVPPSQSPPQSLMQIPQQHQEAQYQQYQQRQQAYYQQDLQYQPQPQPQQAVPPSTSPPTGTMYHPQVPSSSPSSSTSPVMPPYQQPSQQMYPHQPQPSQMQQMYQMYQMSYQIQQKQKQQRGLGSTQVISLENVTVPPGLEYPEIPSDSEIDPVSRQILHEAYLSEIVFIRALEALEEGYHGPLQTKLGKLAAQDLNTIFGGVVGLTSSSREVVEKIIATARLGKVYYLASIYANSREYINAYSAFFKAHNEGVLRLFTQLYGESSGFKKAVEECTAAEFPGATIMDLFWLVVSRLKYINKLAATQLAIRRAFDDAHQSIESIIRFQTSRLSGEVAPKYNVSWQFGACARASEVRRVEDEFRRFSTGIVAESEDLSGMHESAGLIREIRVGTNETIPPSLKRKLIEQVEVVMQNKASFGLSTEVPAVLMFFSDGIALCLPDSGKFRYKLVHWYLPAELIVTDTRPRTEELTFRMARRIPTGEAQILPPGWEDVPKGNGKHTYVNKYLNKSQSQRPECITPCEAVQHILVSDSEVYDKCVSRIRDATNGVGLTPESTPVPYVMIGSKLDQLLAHEQTVYPGITVPTFPKLACHHIISYGLSEQGLFRVAAQKHSIDSMCQLINTGHLLEIDFTKENIHLVTSLLKLFLRDMPEPLIPHSHYADFMGVYRIDNPEEKKARLSHLIALLPRPNRDLLHELLSFEFQIAANTHVNSMDTMNLAIVTAPNILYAKGAKEDIAAITTSNYVVDFMIAHYKELFEAAASESPGESVQDENDCDYEWVSFKRKLIGHTKGIRIMARNASGNNILSVDGDGKGYVWDSCECSYIKQVDIGLKYPSAVVLVGNNFWIATQDAIYVVDSSTYGKVGEIPVGAFSLALSPDGSEVWCGTEGNIVVIDTSSFQKRAEIPVQKQTVFFTIISVGSTFWCAGHSRGMEQSIYVFDWVKRAEINRFPAHTKKINALHLVGDHTVWSGSDDFSICIWDTRTFTLVEKLVKHGGAVFGFCALGDQVWSCSWDKTIMIWEPHTFKYLGEIKGYHTDSVVALVPVNRGNTVDVWSQSHDKALCVWSVRPAPSVVSLH